MDIYVESWSEFKSLLLTKKVLVQYVTRTVGADVWYHIFFIDGASKWAHEIKQESPASTTQDDFETNYLPVANKSINPKDNDGRDVIVSMSKPQGWQTSFSMAGDTPTEIYGGSPITWDFSNSDNEVTAPTGFKRKRMEMQFIDPIRIKEGTLYFHNAPKGCYLDMIIVAKAGSAYYDNSGNLVPVVEDTPFAKYVAHHFMQGDCPMGDELNTETAMEDDFPPYYAIWVEVTTPITDILSNGYAELELFRQRTMIL